MINIQHVPKTKVEHSMKILNTHACCKGLLSFCLQCRMSIYNVTECIAVCFVVIKKLWKCFYQRIREGMMYQKIFCKFIFNSFAGGFWRKSITIEEYVYVILYTFILINDIYNKIESYQSGILQHLIRAPVKLRLHFITTWEFFFYLRWIVTLNILFTKIFTIIIVSTVNIGADHQ